MWSWEDRNQLLFTSSQPTDVPTVSFFLRIPQTLLQFCRNTQGCGFPCVETAQKLSHYLLSPHIQSIFPHIKHSQSTSSVKFQWKQLFLSPTFLSVSFTQTSFQYLATYLTIPPGIKEEISSGSKVWGCVLALFQNSLVKINLKNPSFFSVDATVALPVTVHRNYGGLGKKLFIDSERHWYFLKPQTGL